jgi:hypothetical protein
MMISLSSEETKKKTNRPDSPDKQRTKDAPLLPGTLAKIKAIFAETENVGLIEALLHTAGFRQDLIDYFSGPVIYHGRGGGWVGPADNWLKRAIATERLATICEEYQAGESSPLATDIEAMAYLSSTAFEALLRTDDFQVFMWVSQAVLPRYGKILEGETFAGLIGLDQPVTLSDYQARYALDVLKSKIRRSVIKHAKARRKKEAAPHGKA